MYSPLKTALHDTNKLYERELTVKLEEFVIRKRHEKGRRTAVS